MAQSPALRVVTAAELAKHDAANDSWVSMHGLVFDIDDKLLEDHPGGPDVISILAGKDSTQDFEDIAHSDAARDWANKLIVGVMDTATEEQKARGALPRGAELNSASGSGMGMIVGAVAVALAAAAALVVMKRR